MSWMFPQKHPLKVVEEALRRRKVKYQRMSDDLVLSGFLLDDVTYMLAIRSDLERKTLIFLVNPTRSPENKLQTIGAGSDPMLRVHTAAGQTEEQVNRVCELLLHTNYEMLLGNLERDRSDGEIRFRVALPYRDKDVSVEQVDWCVDIAVASCARAVGQILEIIGGPGGMEV
jgi:hypothetical protein